MAQKIILTEHQHTLIVNQIINEMLKDVDESTLLNEEPIDEGLWDSIKYGLSKLGRYKAGGKILGKGKVDKEAAAKIQAIVDKKGNEMIKNFDNVIKDYNPEFPNNKDPKLFLSTVMGISSVYDSIVAATQKQPNEEGYMPIDVANGVINDLREYVKKFLDVDLKAIYSTVDEAEGNVMELSEEDLKEIDEAFGLTEDYFDAVTEDILEGLDEDQAGDLRAKLQAKRGSGDDFASTRMSTLKSNKLPLILAGIGGSLGALGWMAQTEWFKTWLEGLLGATKTVTGPDIVKDVTGNEADSKGMLHWMSKINQGEGLPPVKTGADVQAFVDKFGPDNVKHMFDGNGGGSVDAQIQQLQQLVGGDNASKPVGELFNPSNDTFGSMKGGQNLFGVSKAASFLAKIVIKKGATSVVKGAGTALAAKLAGLGAVLAPIGIGIAVTGGLVKLMRLKGQKSSRAATLNALYQSIRNLEGGTGIIEPEGETIDAGSAKDPNAIEDKNKEAGTGAGDTGAGDTGAGGAAGGKGGVNDDDLYNSLRNLFRFIVDSNKKFGGGPEKTSADSNQGAGVSFKKGDKAIYKGRNVTVTVPEISPGNTQVDADGDGPEKKTYAVKTSDLKKPLSEATYFRDKELVKYLNKNLSPNRVKEFENFLNRIEQIRNKIRNMRDGDDKVFNQKLATFKQNPIILTDFNRMFNISSANPQASENLAKFINDIFSTVYTGKFKKGELMTKLAGMGKVGAKDISEEQFKQTQIEKDAQDRKKFKKHLMQFITDAIGLFQYMFQQRKNAGTKGGQQQNTDKQAAKLGIKPKPARKSGGASAASAPAAPATPPTTSESKEEKSPLLSEELNRIKNIMRQVI